MLALQCTTIVIVSQGNKLKLQKVSRRRIVWNLGLEDIIPKAIINLSDQNVQDEDFSQLRVIPR